MFFFVRFFGSRGGDIKRLMSEGVGGASRRAVCNFFVRGFATFEFWFLYFCETINWR